MFWICNEISFLVALKNWFYYFIVRPFMYKVWSGISPCSLAQEFRLTLELCTSNILFLICCYISNRWDFFFQVKIELFSHIYCELAERWGSCFETVSFGWIGNIPLCLTSLSFSLWFLKLGTNAKSKNKFRMNQNSGWIKILSFSYMAFDIKYM